MPEDRLGPLQGGVEPYGYQWSGVLTGNDSLVSGALDASGWLYLDVTSDDGQNASDELFITVSDSAPPCTL